ncbi:MAG: hypothetical protein HN742_15130 [Lentisphaerae bacterium]|jgi:hypothetical protein|nr:hypothetical protein [Lentisphaerota bacterium]MBT5609595.1 hypothetical protein [Lentisphaerota bacterium]MBT7843210.1 hypothetical protein [Lentisphaerota bacterium]
MKAKTCKRTTRDKVALFCRFFTGLKNVYGTYDPKTGRVCQVKEPVTEEVILAHLKGQRPYGVYLLEQDLTCAAAIDFDDNDPETPKAFVSRAAEHGISSYIERSKSKGYHVWLFFSRGGVKAAKARLVVRHILREMGTPDTEVFPKQDSLRNGIEYGNFINAPLFGALVPQGRTVFVDPGNAMDPFPNQWDFLEQVRLVPEVKLDEIIAADRLVSPVHAVLGEQPRTVPSPRFLPRSSLPICAQRMLNEGVTENQRVACFRLAIHFNRLGIPFDITVAALSRWAQKNKPTDDKGVITATEIKKQADCAYKKSYRSFGCDEPAVKPFCSAECPIHWRVDPKSVNNGGKSETP